MSDDRELVELLAAIDATPRASWVAGLRADLDAAWEIEDTGYLDSLRTTTVSLVEHEPTQPTSGRRWPILISAAAAVVLVGVLVVYDGDVTPADEPSPTATVPPTTPPRPLPLIGGFAGLRAGTYYVDEVSGTSTPRIFVTIGHGWGSDSGGLSYSRQSELRDPSGGTISFSRLPVAVFSDACHWRDGYHPGPVDTVDDFVAALSEQRGWADVTAPSDISIDGYVGKALQRTAPADISDCTRSSAFGRRLAGPGTHLYPAFRSWDPMSPYEPGQIETLWVLDIDGTVVVISAELLPSEATVTVAVQGPSAADRAEFAAVLDSIRIDRG